MNESTRSQLEMTGAPELQVSGTYRVGPQLSAAGG